MGTGRGRAVGVGRMNLPEPIFDAVGRLAFLSFRVDACRDSVRRDAMLRDMHATSERLTTELGRLCDCSVDLAEPTRVTQAPN